MGTINTESNKKTKNIYNQNDKSNIEILSWLSGMYVTNSRLTFNKGKIIFKSKDLQIIDYCSNYLNKLNITNWVLGGYTKNIYEVHTSLDSDFFTKEKSNLDMKMFIAGIFDNRLRLITRNYKAGKKHKEVYFELYLNNKKVLNIIADFLNKQNINFQDQRYLKRIRISSKEALQSLYELLPLKSTLLQDNLKSIIN